MAGRQKITWSDKDFSWLQCAIIAVLMIIARKKIGNEDEQNQTL